MEKDSKIYVAGHLGMVGSAVVRRLSEEGYKNLLTRPRQRLDLLDGAAVGALLAAERPAYAVLAAARVGGILANRDHPADFLWENLTIQNNVLQACRLHGVKKLLFLGSSCIYPKHAPQPLREDALLTGPLEPTNDAYAIAKIAGIKLCDAMNRQYGTDFLAAMPTNLYGPGDNFDLLGSHVLPAMVRKFHLAARARARDTDALRADEARFGAVPEDVRAALRDPDPAVLLWGTGSPRREFLYSDDLAAACVFLLEHAHARDLGGEATADRNPCALVNVGYGEDVTLRELASLVAETVGYEGPVRWDTSRPDGTPRKLLDSSRLFALGWRPRVTLREGVARLYRAYLDAT